MALLVGCADVAESPQASTLGSDTCDDITAGGGWENDFLPQAAGRAEYMFRATPLSSGGPIDAVVGFSDGRADAFADLGPIVRFNAQGFVDARNGGSYQAVEPFAYQPGTEYEVDIQVDVATRTYDAYVSEVGATNRQVIGQGFAFRSEQASVTRLDIVGRKIDSANGTLKICNFVPLVFGTGRPSEAGTGWTGVTFPEQTGHFVAEFWGQAGLGTDGVIGLSSAMPRYFDDLAAIVRFNPAGYFDVRDGSTYRYDERHVWDYHGYWFVFDVDVPTKRYSVTARSVIDGSPTIVLATDYAFRTSQQGVASLSTLGQIVDSSNGFLWTEQLKVAY